MRHTLLVGLLVCIIVCSSAARGVTTQQHNQQNRQLLVQISRPDKPPKTTQFDASLLIRTDDLPAKDPRISKPAVGCRVPEQVHLTYWTATSVLVSYATCDASSARKAAPVDGVKSIVLYGTSSNQYTSSATGVTTSYAYDYKDRGSYASPLLHHVLLKDLVPGKTYFYKVLGTQDAGNTKTSAVSESGAATSKEFNFTVPSSFYPFRLGVMSDPGQTYNSSEVLQRMIASKPQLLLLAGDFSYADDWKGQDARIDWSDYGAFSYQPKWDTWGRLFEPLLSHVPFIHTNGNHEIEQQPDGQRNSAYNHRYPAPLEKSTGPTQFAPVSTKNPFANMYYSVELPGIMKVIFLTSYSPGQTFSTDEGQYVWLKQELQQTDRKKTPWLIVSTHAPWYNSYAGHFKENECMRQTYEPLLLQHQVDIMFFGHVHSYERTKPVANYQVDECGPVHFTVGDGGNIEGLYKEFIDSVQPKPDYCSNPTSGKQFPSYQPQACLSTQQGEYCPSQQPAWSAYREPSFGHGMLEFLNATHAKWKWTKNQWPTWKVADEVVIIRGRNKACAAAGAASSTDSSKQAVKGASSGSKPDADSGVVKPPVMPPVRPHWRHV